MLAIRCRGARLTSWLYNPTRYFCGTITGLTEMRLREATSGDVLAMSNIGEQAFKEDPFFNFFCTYNHHHPDDMRSWIAGELQKAISTPGKVVMVSCADRSTGSHDAEDITGWAYWERQGTDKGASKWLTDHQSTESTDDKSGADSSKENHSFKPECYEHYQSLVKKAFAPIAPNRWHLLLVAVDSGKQGQGIGKELLQWGFDKATQEHVPIALESTESGKRLYEKTGFKTTEFLTLRPGLRVPAMIWNPKHQPTAI